MPRDWGPQLRRRERQGRWRTTSRAPSRRRRKNCSFGSELLRLPPSHRHHTQPHRLRLDETNSKHPQIVKFGGRKAKILTCGAFCIFGSWAIFFIFWLPKWLVMAWFWGSEGRRSVHPYVFEGAEEDARTGLLPKRWMKL